MPPSIIVRVATCCRASVRRDVKLPGSTEEYVGRTVASLLRSDIPHEQLQVFETRRPKATPEYIQEVEQCGATVIQGKWRGFFEAYANALHHPFEGDWMLVLEDDVEVDPLIYSKTQAFIEANPELRIATLFDQLLVLRDKLWIDPGYWWGSQAVLFHRSVIPCIPDNFTEFLRRWPEMKPILFFPVWDAVISMCCKEPRMYVHRPTLVEHIGTVRSWTDLAAGPVSFATRSQCLTSQAA